MQISLPKVIILCVHQNFHVMHGDFTSSSRCEVKLFLINQSFQLNQINSNLNTPDSESPVSTAPISPLHLRPFLTHLTVFATEAIYLFRSVFGRKSIDSVTVLSSHSHSSLSVPLDLSRKCQIKCHFLIFSCQGGRWKQEIGGM